MTNGTNGTGEEPSDGVRALARQAYEMGGQALSEGRAADAEKVFRGLVEMLPRDAEAHSHLALALAARGAGHDAERHFREAAELAPDEAGHWLNLAKVYAGQNRTRRAQRALAEAERRAPGNAEVLYLAALLLRARGDLAGFERRLRELLQHQPDHAAALNDLGCLLAERGGRPEEAIEFLRRAVDAPGGAGSAVNLGNALYLAHDLDGARAAFATAIEHDPAAAEALRGLAMIERRQLRLGEAEAHARAYCEHAPQPAMARNLLGTVLREQGAYEAAREAFRAALAVDPDFAPAASNLAMLELLLGEWSEGFRRYEARWRDSTYTPRRNYRGLPHWDGSDGADRRILLFAEQGFGDGLQFCRFARDVKDRGFEVHLEAPRPLRRLLATLDPTIRIAPAEGHDADVDVIAPLMSLPYLLGIDGPERLSGAPYLSVPPEVGPPAVPLDADVRLRVGLNWRGNPRHMEDLKRSLPPETLAPLAEVDSVQFVDLGLEPDGRRAEAPLEAVDAAPLIDDFADTAALMQRLDLVVTVDTATAHLAGALGVPCWVMLPYVPDWRWLTAREDSPWYPSVRLFRQASVGDWPDVVRRVASALAARAAG